jgi:hypothetical protein
MKKVLCVLLLLVLAFFLKESLTAFFSVVVGTVHFVIDEHWFGIRNLTVELSREFNVRADPEMEKLHTEIDKTLRLAAARAYRMHYGNMESVAESTMRAQQIEMRYLSDVLDGVSSSMFRNKTLMAFVAESRYNNNAAEILPNTWALVFVVVNSCKQNWMDSMARAADTVRKELRNKNAVVEEMFKDSHPVQRSYRERVTEFATECFVLLSSVSVLSVFQ